MRWAQCSACADCRATKETKKAENALAELRGRAEAEKEGFKAAAAAAEQRTVQLQAALGRAEGELTSYKARAHTLLKAKDAELGKAREEARSQLAGDLAHAQDEAAAAITELKRVRS